MITKTQPAVKTVRREQENLIHRNQLWWSGLIALVLAVAALAKWTAPKNALMEQDRNPASYRSDSKNLGTND